MGRRGRPAPLAVTALLALLCVGAALEGGINIAESQIAARDPEQAAGCDTGVEQAAAAAAAGAAAAPAAVATLATPAHPSPSHPHLADDSVRCRLSGICDGPHSACNASSAPAAAASGAGGGYGSELQEEADPLACVTSDEGRAAAVVEAARHAWSGYRDCAWGEDELQPLSCTGVHWFNLSLTMVDSLDTLYLLGMRREFEEAAGWLVDHLNVGAPSEVNLFETTIRVLGGLLAAQALSVDSHPQLSRQLAEKAAELGARLMPAFDSPSGVPFSDVNLRTGQASPPKWGHISSLSEMCSVSLEFTYLARITGHGPFEEVPLAVHERLEAAASAGGGLLGQFFNPLTGKAQKDHGATITLGARTDSYYEYLLKQWLVTGKSEGWLRERYVQAMQSVRSRLLKRTAPPGRPGLWYVGEQKKKGEISGKMDHLVCFLPGLLALGDFHNVSTRASDPYAARPDSCGSTTATTCRSSSAGTSSADSSTAQTAAAAAAEAAARAAAEAATAAASAAGAEGMTDLQVAHELALSCYELYRRSPAGLAPEIAHFEDNSESHDYPNRHVHDVGHGDFHIKPNDAHNLLRPESLESFYLLWKVTGDPQYKHWAWQVFRALEKWARVRPQDRHERCLDCLAEAAAEAARSASGGNEGADEAGETGRHLRRAAAEEVLQSQLRGGELCSSCSATGGYTSLESVLSLPPVRRDKMESFFLAETLKYLYLIFVEPPDRCLHPSCQAGQAEQLEGAPPGQQQQEQIAGQQQEQQRQQQQQGAGQQQGQQQEQHPERISSSSSTTGASSTSGSSGTDSGSRLRRRPLLPLDRFVFTTEAHPLPIVGSAVASGVAQVLHPSNPLLRPFENAGSGSGGSDDGAAAATAAAAGVLKAAQRGQQQQQQPLLLLRNGTAQVLETVLEDMLHKLSDAASAMAAVAGRALPRVLAGSSTAPATAAAGTASAEEEDEEELYADGLSEEEDAAALDGEEMQGEACADGSSRGAAAAATAAADEEEGELYADGLSEADGVAAAASDEEEAEYADGLSTGDDAVAVSAADEEQEEYADGLSEMDTQAAAAAEAEKKGQHLTEEDEC